MSPTKIPKELAIISIYSKFLKPDRFCNNSVKTPKEIRPINNKNFLKDRLAVNTKKERSEYTKKWMILSFSVVFDS
tara:strand:+ start:216 stop:443 length:228 start_codon:yes stop_codon:yes gene_type:complete